jgi:predicted O-methyltransferase YrrM
MFSLFSKKPALEIAGAKFRPNPTNAKEVSFLLPYYRSQPIYWELADLVAKGKEIGMLHADVLALLFHFSLHGGGMVLEIGPFIGGSTIAIANGLARRKNAGFCVSIEKGGLQEHPIFGEVDILPTLEKNLAKYGVRERVRLIYGTSRDPKVVSQVKQARGGEKFGFVFLDADGHVQADVETYASMIQPRAYLMVDDYFAEQGCVKNDDTREELDAMEKAGKVECLGIYGWGTWVGRFRF